MHHAQMHRDNAFITLTYNDENLPGASLDHREFQLFLKRLRKSAQQGREQTGGDGKPQKISYYMAGEYGTENRRPHFHAAIFGWKPKDGKYWKITPGGSKLYVSETLDKLWHNKGFTSYGEVNFESAAYIARYIMGKITGQAAQTHYTDPETGEILKPEYNRMSLKPGIGKTWIEKYESDAYPEGEILIRGVKTKTPKYYDRLYKKKEPDQYEQMKMERELQSLEYRQDNTDERLRAKEKVKRAQLKSLKRII